MEIVKSVKMLVSYLEFGQIFKLQNKKSQFHNRHKLWSTIYQLSKTIIPKQNSRIFYDSVLEHIPDSLGKTHSIHGYCNSICQTEYQPDSATKFRSQWPGNKKICSATFNQGSTDVQSGPIRFNIVNISWHWSVSVPDLQNFAQFWSGPVWDLRFLTYSPRTGSVGPGSVGFGPWIPAFYNSVCTDGAHWDGGKGGNNSSKSNNKDSINYTSFSNNPTHTKK